MPPSKLRQSAMLRERRHAGDVRDSSCWVLWSDKCWPSGRFDDHLGKELGKHRSLRRAQSCEHRALALNHDRHGLVKYDAACLCEVQKKAALVRRIDRPAKKVSLQKLLDSAADR